MEVETTILSEVALAHKDRQNALSPVCGAQPLIVTHRVSR